MRQPQVCINNSRSVEELDVTIREQVQPDYPYEEQGVLPPVLLLTAGKLEFDAEWVVDGDDDG